MSYLNTKKINLRVKNQNRITSGVSWTLLGLFLFTLLGCFDFGDTYSKLPPGPWRGVLKLDPERSRQQEIRRETKVSENISFDEVTEGDLPFTFDVVYDDPENFHLEIHNAEETIILDQITLLKDRATNKDTLFIEFPPYDSYFKVIFEDNILEGDWIVPSRGANYQVHFVARHGKNYRFTTLQKEPVADLSGKWEVTFGLDDSVPEPAIGYFTQNGNYLTGTFETESGDYRYLEGTVQANKMYLSCFDGAHMFLFEALIQDDGTLSGVFRSGTHFITSWIGIRNESAKLRDPGSITTFTGNDFDFSFPDESGKIIHLHDPAFEGKPKIIQIMGTWCPNCVDETRYLSKFLRENDPDLVVIGLAFERHKDLEKAKAAIARFRNKLDLPYPILYAGSSDKDEASKQLPLFNKIFAFPTLVFLDHQNKVKSIHTGFNGPATPGFEKFKKDFDESVREILVHNQ